MSNSIDIPTRDRRPRRMRYQESPFAQTQPQSPAPSADAGPAGSDAYSKANSEYGRLYVDSRSSLPSSSLYSTSSPFGTPSSYDAAVSSVDGSPAVPHAMSMAERRAHDKGKGRAVDGATASPTSPARGSVSERRTSFMGGTPQTLCRHLTQLTTGLQESPSLVQSTLSLILVTLTARLAWSVTLASCSSRSSS